MALISDRGDADGVAAGGDVGEMIPSHAVAQRRPGPPHDDHLRVGDRRAGGVADRAFDPADAGWTLGRTAEEQRNGGEQSPATQTKGPAGLAVHGNLLEL